MADSVQELNGTQMGQSTQVEPTPEAPNDVAVIKEDLVTELNPSIFETSNAPLFSSIHVTDRATGIKVYNAINGAENALSDHLGEVIEVTDMVAHPITLEDDQTKEKINAMRVVLLTADGVGYHSVSGGVVSSLQKIIGIVGQAPWNPGLQVVPVEVKTRKGYKTLTLRLQA
jgi:hypothetical protein